MSYRVFGQHSVAFASPLRGRAPARLFPLRRDGGTATIPSMAVFASYLFQVRQCAICANAKSSAAAARQGNSTAPVVNPPPPSTTTSSVTTHTLTVVANWPTSVITGVASGLSITHVTFTVLLNNTTVDPPDHRAAVMPTASSLETVIGAFNDTQDRKHATMALPALTGHRQTDDVRVLEATSGLRAALLQCVAQEATAMKSRASLGSAAATATVVTATSSDVRWIIRMVPLTDDSVATRLAYVVSRLLVGGDDLNANPSLSSPSSPSSSSIGPPTLLADLQWLPSVASRQLARQLMRQQAWYSRCREYVNKMSGPSASFADRFGSLLQGVPIASIEATSKHVHVAEIICRHLQPIVAVLCDVVDDNGSGHRGAATTKAAGTRKITVMEVRSLDLKAGSLDSMKYTTKARLAYEEILDVPYEKATKAVIHPSGIPISQSVFDEFSTMFVTGPSKLLIVADIKSFFDSLPDLLAPSSDATMTDDVRPGAAPAAVPSPRSLSHLVRVFLAKGGIIWCSNSASYWANGMRRVHQTSMPPAAGDAEHVMLPAMRFTSKVTAQASNAATQTQFSLLARAFLYHAALLGRRGQFAATLSRMSYALALVGMQRAGLCVAAPSALGKHVAELTAVRDGLKRRQDELLLPWLNVIRQTTPAQAEGGGGGGPSAVAALGETIEAQQREVALNVATFGPEFMGIVDGMLRSEAMVDQEHEAFRGDVVVDTDVICYDVDYGASDDDELTGHRAKRVTLWRPTKSVPSATTTPAAASSIHYVTVESTPMSPSFTDADMDAIQTFLNRQPHDQHQQQQSPRLVAFITYNSAVAEMLLRAQLMRLRRGATKSSSDTTHWVFLDAASALFASEFSAAVVPSCVGERPPPVTKVATPREVTAHEVDGRAPPHVAFIAAWWMRLEQLTAAGNGASSEGTSKVNTTPHLHTDGRNVVEFLLKQHECRRQAATSGASWIPPSSCASRCPSWFAKLSSPSATFALPTAELPRLAALEPDSRAVASLIRTYTAVSCRDALHLMTPTKSPTAPPHSVAAPASASLAETFVQLADCEASIRFFHVNPWQRIAKPLFPSPVGEDDASSRDRKPQPPHRTAAGPADLSAKPTDDDAEGPFVLRPTFYLDVAPTGRSSARDPNVFSIPKESSIRRTLVSRFGAQSLETINQGGATTSSATLGRRWSGKMIEVDFSQLEICVAAFLSQDAQLLEDIEKGVDFHCLRAADLTGVEKSRSNNSVLPAMTYEDVVRLYKTRDAAIVALRQKAKIVNFQEQYGASVASVAASTGLHPDTIIKSRNAYDKRYPRLSLWRSFVSSRAALNAAKVYGVQKSSELPSLVRTGAEIPSTANAQWFPMKRRGWAATLEQRSTPLAKASAALHTSMVPADAFSDALPCVLPTGSLIRLPVTPQNKGGSKPGFTCEYTAVRNYPVQAAAADLVALATGNLYRSLLAVDFFQQRAFLVNVVHDSVWIDARDDVVEAVVRLCETTLRQALWAAAVETNLWPGFAVAISGLNSASPSPQMAAASQLPPTLLVAMNVSVKIGASMAEVDAK